MAPKQVLVAGSYKSYTVDANRNITIRTGDSEYKFVKPKHLYKIGSEIWVQTVKGFPNEEKGQFVRYKGKILDVEFWRDDDNEGEFWMSLEVEWNSISGYRKEVFKRDMNDYNFRHWNWHTPDPTASESAWLLPYWAYGEINDSQRGKIHLC